MLGVSAAGWVVGLACFAVLYASVLRGLSVYAHKPGPADLVTLFRATLACAVAGLAVDALVADPDRVLLVSLAAASLVLDAVDGPVARLTGTISAFGGKFDGEADAFLMLVLSVYVAASAGLWVLAIGGMRYAFWLAGVFLPWMRARLPYRYWRKVVTAAAGITLAVAAAGIVPAWLSGGALLLVLAVLAESFARDVLWLHRRRTVAVEPRVLAVGGP